MIILLTFLMTLFTQASELPKKISCKSQDIYTITIDNAHLISEYSAPNPGTIIHKDQVGIILKINKGQGYASYNRMNKTIEAGSLGIDNIFLIHYNIASGIGFFQIGMYYATIDKCNL